MSDAAPPAPPAPDIPRAPDAPPATPFLPAWAAPVLVALAYLAFWQIAPRLRASNEPATLVSTVISLALIVWFTAQFARAFRAPRALLWNAAAAALLSVPLRVMLGMRAPLFPWIYLLYVPGLPDLLLVWLAASLGALLSFLLRGANMIPPVAAVMALVDIWTVLLGGPVQKAMQSQNPVAQAVSSAMVVRLPAPTAGAAPYRLGSMVGFADFLFIAFFVAAVCRFVPVPGAYRRTLQTLVLVLCAYMLLVHFSGWSLPALVPMAVVMIALHWRRFHYERSEAFALLYAALFVALIAAGFWYFGRLKG